MTFLRDVRFGLLMMRKNPGFTLVALLTLVLGIGANTAIFSVVNSVLLRPLPYEGAEQLVRIHSSKPPQFDQFPISPGDFMEWQEQTKSFEQIAAYFTGPPLILTGSGDPEQFEGAHVSASAFPLLRVAPLMGRTFLPEEEGLGNDQVVVLSYGLWQRRFGADPRIIGQPVRLSDQSYTVIGVMPANFKFPSDRTEAWVPTGFAPDDRDKHGAHYLSVLARLKPGVGVQQSQAEIDTVGRRLAEQYPDSNAGWNFKVVTWQEDIVGPIKPALLLVSGAVLFVLLIACVNVTNLLLARAAARSREMSIRAALGASRGQIVRQLLTESLVLSLIGGALGLLLTIWGVKLLLALASETLPVVNGVTVDGRVLGFTLILSLLTGVIFGLVPALQVSTPNLTESLKEGGRGGTEGVGRSRLRKLLVVSEVVLALVLLIGAGLLIRSFLRLRDVNPGFNSRNVLTMKISLPRTRYPEEAQQAAFFEKVLQNVSTLPGVQTAAAVAPLPFDGDMNYDFVIEGRPAITAAETPSANYYLISPDYFRVMGVPLLKGRPFNERDRKGVPRVAIINETMARKYFPGEDPIGKRINVTNGSDVLREIVGVSGDVKQYGLDDETKSQIYEPYLQEPFFVMTLAVRTEGDPMILKGQVYGKVLSIDKEQPVTGVRTLDSIVAESLARRRFTMALFSIFAAVALTLATIGIYGVMSYLVSQRTHEIGIRMTLGAQAGDIMKLVVGQGVLLVVIGTVIGLLAAFALTRVMSSLLFGVSATDFMTFALVSVLLFVVAILASYIPARRAMRVDPMTAMRRE
jgi:putative ABC transport system permease protein